MVVSWVRWFCLPWFGLMNDEGFKEWGLCGSGLQGGRKRDAHELRLFLVSLEIKLCSV